MKLTVLIFVLSLVAGPSLSHAAGLGSSVASNFQNPNDQKGLCTPDNEDQTYMKVGLCQSLWEQLNSGCTKDLVEKIRKRILDEDGQQKYWDPGFYCSSEAKGEKKSRGLKEIAKNPRQFTYMLMQFFAAVAIKTSGWDVLAEAGEAGQQPSMDKKQGVYNLSTKEMMNGDYKCGCQDKVVTCPNAEGANGENSIASESCPGSIDGHHSMICGTYMALYHAEKDGALFSGKAKKGGEDEGPKGAARLWKVLEDDNKDASAQKDPDDPEDSPTTKGFIRKKMKAFCKSDGASQVEKWQSTMKDITLDGNGQATPSTQ